MSASKPKALSNNNNIQREPFRWLFVAHFKDDTFIEQPADDQSKKHVEGAEHNPSSFSDVLEREADLIGFELKHTETKEHVYVDLVSGAFLINGTPFHAHDQNFEPLEHKLKLVYFRETRIEHDMDGNISRHFVNRYFVGWQAEGTKQKAIIAVG